MAYFFGPPCIYLQHDGSNYCRMNDVIVTPCISIAALESSDIENKIFYCRQLSELCHKSDDGHSTALTVCEQLKVNAR